MRRFPLYLAILLVMVLTPPAVAASEVRIAVLGDSLTAGYGLAPAESFPAQLERRLQAAGHAVNISNAGVSGDTTAGGRARLAWLLADRPDAVIVELGGNDALRGLDPRQTYANLAAILERLQQDNIPVLLAGMRAPRNLGPEFAAAFDRVYAELAENYDVVYYPFFLDGVAGSPGLNLPDGIHPTAAGVAEIVSRIMPRVEELLQRVAEQTPSAR